MPAHGAAEDGGASGGVIGAAIGGGALFLAMAGMAGFFMMRKKAATDAYVQEQSVDVDGMLDAEMALTKEQYAEAPACASGSA